MPELLMQNNFDLDDLLKLAVFVILAVGGSIGSLLKKKSAKDEVEVEVLEEDEGWIEVETDAPRSPAANAAAPSPRSGTKPPVTIPPAPPVRAPRPATTRPASAIAQSRRAKTPGSPSAPPPGGRTVPPAPPPRSVRNAERARGGEPARGPNHGAASPAPPQPAPSPPARRSTREHASLEARHLQAHPGHLEEAMQSRRVSRVEGEHLRPHFESAQPEEHGIEPGHAGSRATGGEVKLRLARGDLRHAVILAEILAPPLALRSD
ncbi:MAG: hypothetical protein IT449_03325 [Phycisphaerales bacterium]|nr:hypothetical protein [Phycisphaerales bacterium]